jgi:hypothetical protein
MRPYSDRRQAPSPSSRAARCLHVAGPVRGPCPITAHDLKYANEEAISTFEALDEQGARDAKASLGFDAPVIATTDYGDPRVP